jgi:hypothetical protein
MLSIVVRTVVAPDGRTWKVRRKWLTRTVHWRGPVSMEASWLPGPGELLPLDPDLGCLPALGLAVTSVAVVLLMVFFVIPALAFALELVIVLLLVGLGVLGRILFRRPWTVEARLAGTNEGRQWRVAGWRASGEQVTAVAERLEATGRVGDVTWSPAPADDG